MDEPDQNCPTLEQLVAELFGTNDGPNHRMAFIDYHYYQQKMWACCERQITIEEIMDEITVCVERKSPGLDDLLYEFYCKTSDLFSSLLTDINCTCNRSKEFLHP